MEPTSTDAFARIISQIQSQLAQVQVLEEDYSPQRALLRVSAGYGSYRVFITEILSTTARKYRYYVLDGDFVVAGFDNAPDARALHQKYGAAWKRHVGEAIPHLHLEDKAVLELTDEMTVDKFLTWLVENILPEG